MTSKRTRWMRRTWLPTYYAWSSFTGLSDVKPSTMPGQFLTSIFYFCNVLIFSSYTANLAASLTQQRLVVDIQGYEDIGTDKMPATEIMLQTVGGSL